MMHLEWHLDKLNEAADDLMQSGHHGDLTEEEIIEFKEEFTTQIRDLMDEVSSLGGHLMDAVNELYAKLPTCTTCAEVLNEDNRDEEFEYRCRDCVEEDQRMVV